MRIVKINQLKQLEVLRDLAFEIWQEHYVPLIGREQVDYMLEKMYSLESLENELKSHYQFDLIFSDTVAVGYSSYSIEDDAVKLHKLYLKLASRGQGLGRKLLDEVLNYAVSNSIFKIQLNVNKGNTHSIMAYEALGFKVIKEVKIDIGSGFFMDDFIMQKLLS